MYNQKGAIMKDNHEHKANGTYESLMALLVLLAMGGSA